MAVNTFVMSGEVKRLEVNERPTRKGPAAIILLQYGPSRQRTSQPVQFINVALVRVPPYLYERCKEDLAVGSLVDITGHVQGVLKPLISEGFVTNELVATRLEVVDSGYDEDVQDDFDEEDLEGAEAEALEAEA